MTCSKYFIFTVWPDGSEGDQERVDVRWGDQFEAAKVKARLRVLALERWGIEAVRVVRDLAGDEVFRAELHPIRATACDRIEGEGKRSWPAMCGCGLEEYKKTTTEKSNDY